MYASINGTRKPCCVNLVYFVLPLSDKLTKCICVNFGITSKYSSMCSWNKFGHTLLIKVFLNTVLKSVLQNCRSVSLRLNCIKLMIAIKNCKHSFELDILHISIMPFTYFSPMIQIPFHSGLIKCQ